MIFIFILFFVFGLNSPPKKSDEETYNGLNERDRAFVEAMSKVYNKNDTMQLEALKLQFTAKRLEHEKTLSELREKNSVLIAENVVLKDKVKKAESSFMPKTFIGWSMLTLSLVGIFLLIKMYYTLYVS